MRKMVEMLVIITKLQTEENRRPCDRRKTKIVVMVEMFLGQAGRKALFFPKTFGFSSAASLSLSGSWSPVGTGTRRDAMKVQWVDRDDVLQN